MEIRVQEADFDAGEEISKLGRCGAGAIVSFIGLVRDQGGISAMHLEHYPGMTEKALAAIAGEAADRWPLLDAVVIHRVGRLEAQDRIVLVATASFHRADAFSAAEFIMDNLKSRAPFWKKEIAPEGERWVEAKASDDEALGRWLNRGQA